jgi:hypothetical protein
LPTERIVHFESDDRNVKFYIFLIIF